MEARVLECRAHMQEMAILGIAIADLHCCICRTYLEFCRTCPCTAVMDMLLLY